jgi:predicted nucleic acid-binding protein
VSIYFDASALVKLVHVEGESRALRAWIRARPDAPRVTNSVGVVEL